MSELKTLKDISLIVDDATNKAYLKQEAIKWINYLVDTTKMAEEEEAVVNFIKHFFNITSEDLK